MALATSISATSVLGFSLSRTRSTSSLRTHFSLTSLPTTYRFGNGLEVLHRKHSISTVLAGSRNPPPTPEAGKGKTGSDNPSAADGPPLLTILAGITVFLLVSWVLGSIILWIVGLFVNAPPS